ncbi:MAG: hypothetical protein VB089_20805 [Anaerolineaceae bacterium]|nr:hypothetical protein [Anaerolineaceae bacterium]
MNDRLASLRRWAWRVYNAVDYPLRQWFRLRRPGLRLRTRAEADRFTHLAAEEKVRAEAIHQRLRSAYHLEEFEHNSSPVNYRENLFYLDLLEKALDRSGAVLPQQVVAGDIGPSHWFYVQVLAALLRWWRRPQGRTVALTGYEVDAYRVYGDLHSRYDYALAHMRGLAGVEYLPRGFWPQPGRFHLLTMLFPFVFERDHLAWGLPGKLFRPGELVAAAWASLQPGGVLIVVNQGFEEHRAQGEILAAQGIQAGVEFCQEPLLYAYPLDRFVWVACRGS